jgi:hypothetical protein
MEELEAELADMGLTMTEDLEETLSLLTEKGYVETDSKGRLNVGKQTYSMARLLDHAFPGMPGLNLVAYFVQTLDEVESGRKTPPEALIQLDTILRRHSAKPFKKTAAKEQPKKQVSFASPRSRPKHSSPQGLPKFVSPAVIQAKQLKKTPDLSQPLSLNSEEEPSIPFEPEPSPVPDSRVEGVSDIAVESAQGDPIEETAKEQVLDAGEPETEESGQPSLSSEESAIIQEEDHSAEQGVEAEAPPSESADQEPEEPEEPQEEQEFQDVPKDDTDPDESDIEELVAARIEAFEEKLAMQCPVCNQASVEAKETAKGRTYYTCSDEDCVFISWGRPHHIECPRCGNAFLIESTSKTGDTVLKCPRATCRYKKPLDTLESDKPKVVKKVRKPRKKVVRRKVVRRKR